MLFCLFLADNRYPENMLMAWPPSVNVIVVIGAQPTPRAAQYENESRADMLDRPKLILT